MSTTTKTKPDALAEHAALMSTHAAKVAEAEDRRRQCIREAAEAAAYFDELCERLRSGDDTVTALDLLLAQARKGFVQADGTVLKGYDALRLDGAERQLDRLRRSAPVGTDLADAVIESVRAALGVPVDVVVSGGPGAASDAPTATLRARSCEGHPDGFLSGRLELRYRRGTLYAAVSSDAVIETLRAAGHDVEDSSTATTRNGDGTLTDLVVIDCAQAYPEMPAVAYPPTVGEAGRFTEGRPNHPGALPRVAAAVSRRLGGTTVKAEVRSSKVSGESRSVVVDVSAEVAPAKLAEALEALQGKAIGGIGRCTGTTGSALTFGSAVAD